MHTLFPLVWGRAFALCWLALLCVGCGVDSIDAHSTHSAKVSLGEMIFHDKRLSADGSRSCASCHRPDYLFSEPLATSSGVHGVSGTRNAPSLLDVSKSQTFFWDGRGNDLGVVALQPFTNQVEMGLSDNSELVNRIAKARYIPQYRRVFGWARPSESDIASALVAYLSTLNSPESRYDRYVSQNAASALNQSEQQGLSLFAGKAGCVDCHTLQDEPSAFTDHQFHNTGIGFDAVAGNMHTLLATLSAIDASREPLGLAILSNPKLAELGRFAHTREPKDLGAFKTPSLRNVADTAPYMHDGSIKSLPEALEHEIYYRGLTRGRPITLTVEEKQQLIEFLHTLSSISTEGR